MEIFKKSVRNNSVVLLIFRCYNIEKPSKRFEKNYTQGAAEVIAYGTAVKFK